MTERGPAIPSALADLGYDAWFEERRPPADGEVARVAVDDGVAYVAVGARGAVRARLGGKMLREARAGRATRPVVGDWLVVSPTGVVSATLPRRTKLARKAAGLEDAEQVIAANIDVAFVATATGGDVNERRLERYVAVAYEGGVEPVVLLTKADVCADVGRERARIRAVAAEVEVLAVSGRTGEGVAAIKDRLPRGRTGALVGSSGVGKSTLLNRLMGEALQATGDLRDDGRGRHTTTRRSLFVLPSGGLLVDTPGMRELGLIDAGGRGLAGLAEAFADVAAVSTQCRFRDCRHHAEPGCAVRHAVETGTLAAERVDSWRKLAGEIATRGRNRR
jgi:ribosome biogenesis GTPase